MVSEEGIYPFPMVPHLRKRFRTSRFFSHFCDWLTYNYFFDLTHSGQLPIPRISVCFYFFFSFLLSLSLSFPRICLWFSNFDSPYPLQCGIKYSYRIRMILKQVYLTIDETPKVTITLGPTEPVCNENEGVNTLPRSPKLETLHQMLFSVIL